MNEGDSAGGGHQGSSPAPPAVTDRRSTIASNNINQQLYNQVIQGRSATSGSAVLVSSVSPHYQTTQTRYLLGDQQRIPSQSQQLQAARVIVSHESGPLSLPQLSEPDRGQSVSFTSTSLGSLIQSSTSLSVSQVSSDSSSSVTPVGTSNPQTSVCEGSDSSDSLLLAARKRLRREITQAQQPSGVSVATLTVSATINDINVLKKRILEYKFSRLRSIKEKYSENVAELYFLQTGGNMMDYPTWRKKPPTPQFINFTRSYRLDSADNEDTNKSTSQHYLKQVVNTAQTSYSPQGAEIKIPSVGATPVAVSTTLPAAVVQLTQQGHIPGRPQGGRHGMVFGQIPVPSTIRNSSVPLVPGGTPILPDISNVLGADKQESSVTLGSSNISNTHCMNGGGSAGGNQDQFSVKAKQEVYVMQRISELQREGLWTEKRLPKLQEPLRPKAHWDYLLEEMVWLAADFAQERKWKKSAAKKCARMVQKHFMDKASALQRAEKAHEIHLKRVAAFIAKEVKMFWSNVEKLVEYKHQTKLEEKRKKALDQHLSFIVDQTEKFSQQLAEGMNKHIVENSTAPSINSSRISSPKHKGLSDDEFCPANELSDDDEETIAKAEAEAINVSEEVSALQRESAMDLDDFLNELPKDYLQNRDKIVLESNSSESSRDDEFEAIDSSEDDEDTIVEQEIAEKDVDHKKELQELNAENEMSLDELMARYSGTTKTVSHAKPEHMEVDSDDDSDDDEESDSNSMSVGSEEASSDGEYRLVSLGDEDVSDSGLKSLLLEEQDVRSQQDKNHLINDAAAIAESIQPKGNTLSSTNVVTPVPFLLKHSLREYQHIGLDWLVTMNDRKLNGILADEMGLGKTIQTIALLAHLACVKSNWGPHLIIVPSSVMLNWEMEFKKWCPGFKILTYYGTQKERKQKRIGWTKANAFHVCITSYKLVIQDQQSFRRKKWKYFILDEAQNIKNFKSQRWQLLLNFQTDRRLLLTGTPLQNNLMELWSLMHFLMPHVFQSHREFKEWFSNPMTGMIEGNSEYNESIIKRLHKVLRPFLLRRLKSEVEKQMPKKYEHIVMCRLSKRQRYLYDDFMCRAKTRETLACGNLLSVMNVLMQLRKVCNHPNLFEVRPTISPFRMEGLAHRTASFVCNMLNYSPFKHIDLGSLNLELIRLEETFTAYISHRVKKLATPRKLIEEIDSLPDPPPRCPSGKYRFHIRIKDTRVQNNLLSNSGVKVGTSPAMKTEGNKLVPVVSVDKKHHNFSQSSCKVNLSINNSSIPPFKLASSTSSVLGGVPVATHIESSQNVLATRQQVMTATESNTSTKNSLKMQTNQRMIIASRMTDNARGTRGMTSISTARSAGHMSSGLSQNAAGMTQNLVATLAQHFKTNSVAPASQKFKTMNQSTPNSDYYFADRERMAKERRQNRLHLLARINQRRCDSSPIYGADLRKSIERLLEPCKSLRYSTWHSRSFTNTMQASSKSENWSFSKLVKSNEDRTVEMIGVLTNYVLYVPAVSAPAPYLHAPHLIPSRVNENKTRDQIIRNVLSTKISLLHPIISAMSTQFPDPRLIQYDCGKLQTLDKLLRRLKQESHRVLIFTQMTKMLDVLESFLNYHGHIYLRLDGTTRIEQRQVLMERFNGDRRIFAFILSTRSGGVGVNLTGADTVIFYDSDWNPTMDAQAQDRCHRIGQTRDVHIYRLVSEKTIEENILRKANQKRLLGDLAIEGGNFTTAYFKTSTIQDLFHVENEEDANVRLSELVERDRERRQRLQENLQQTTSNYVAGGDEKTALGAFESALAAAEDEQDVEAATTAKAEAAADLAEFDENIPLDDLTDAPPELSKADIEMENIVKQLSPIERYAMRFVEETGGAWTAEQLRAAEAEIEQQKREWEANRLAALQKEEELRKEEENDDLITYSREDANNQIWISDNTLERMPVWCPPTPPQNDNDIYIDYSLGFLYETDIMPESHLPPIYVKKEYKRSRAEAGFSGEARRPPKIRKDDNYYAPRSLFDRPPPAIAKLRRDLKMQRYRGVFKPIVQIPGIKQTIPLKPANDPEGMAEWYIYEDVAILHVLQNLQALPLNLMLLSPGHTPNWDLVADIVNQCSRTYRSPKQCRSRYEAVIQPREEGKLLESPKKQKKLKNQMKSPMMKSGIKAMRTSQLFISDNNNSFTKLTKLKFEYIKAAYLKKSPPPKQVFGVQTPKNPKHVAVLNEFGVTNYDSPMNPIEIAVKKAEKMKEKQRSNLSLPISVQQVQEHPSAQQSITVQQPTTIVVQQSPQVANVQQVTQLMQSSPLQRQTVQTSQLGPHQTTTQIVKAIVTPSSAIVAGQVQHMSQQNTQVQLQQAQLQAGSNVVTPSSVSVVLSTPVSTLSSVQHQTSQSMQIASLQQHTITSASTIITQPSNATLVQTISTQSLPQVVSVSQLATVGQVLTTSASLQSNNAVATLNASALRAQRIVATPGHLQEVVLQQRSNSQSPTIVSMSNLGQGLSQAQLQATQVRLTQQVIAKSITVGSLQQTGKLGNQPASIQLYRQQPIRQQLKVLQTSSGAGNAAAAVVQTAGGQTALVNAAGAIIQSGIVPGQTVQVHGQKIATVSGANVGSGASGVVTSVATVQVAQNQGRTQFIKQIGVGGKQSITRQVSENEMLLVKRPLIGQHKPQVIPQSPIYAQTNVQVQQTGVSGQQQIATLVKTSQGSVAASVGMTLSQLKPGPIKVTMANQNQVRQLQLQQQIAIAQQRKGGKAQLAQVAGKAGVPTQLIVQNSKNLTNSVTVQQIQQVIRHAQPGSSLGGQLVLGKTSVGRVIPVSVASQANARQTIQVVSAASAQALASGNIRAHVANTSNIANTIKVAANATQVQTQQALINALQQSQQNQQRQNASPVRLQTSGAPLVAVPVQQVQSTATIASTSAGTVDVVTLAQQQQQQQQQTTQQQVRNLMKKKLLSVRNEKGQQ